MANNLFVSYDLLNPGQRYAAVAKAIQELGATVKVQKSFWYVRSSLSAEEAAKLVWVAMDVNDTLMVVDATHNTAYWIGVPQDASGFMQRNWYHRAA